MNPVLTVVFPVEVSLDEAFGQNLVRTLESTAVDKLRQQESLPLNHMCLNGGAIVYHRGRGTVYQGSGRELTAC